MVESSSSKHVTVLLYIDGEILGDGDGDGVHYSLGPAKAIRVHKKLKFSQLHDKICRCLNIDTDMLTVRVTCRYPLLTNNGRVNFVQIPVIDDGDVRIVLDAQTVCHSIHAIELYLTREPVCANQKETCVKTGEPSTEALHDNKAQDGGGCENFDVVPEYGVGSNHVSPTAVDDVTQVAAPGVFDSPVSNYPSASSGQVDEEQTTVQGFRNVGSMVMVEKDRHIHRMDITNDMVGNQDAELHHDNPNARSDDKMAQSGEVYAAKPLNACPLSGRLHELPPCFSQVDLSAADLSHQWDDSDDEPIFWEEFEELSKGMTFDSKDDLKHAVKKYSVKRHHAFRVVESKATTWAAKCAIGSECRWKLRASKRKTHQRFEITQYAGPHTCANQTLSQDQPLPDSTLIAKEIVDIVKEDPSTSIAALRATLKGRFNCTLSFKKVWLEKRNALAQLQQGTSGS